MPKLPRDLVKRAAFDNPLRRTTPEEASFATADAFAADVNTAVRAKDSDPGERDETAGGVVLPFARLESEHDANRAAVMPALPPTPDPQPAVMAASPPTPDTQPPANEHRITVRIDDATRRALETECHRRRLAGEKVTVADIARGVLAKGTSRVQ